MIYKEVSLTKGMDSKSEEPVALRSRMNKDAMALFHDLKDVASALSSLIEPGFALAISVSQSPDDPEDLLVRIVGLQPVADAP